MWFLVYLILALINIGLFYAWNPFGILEDDEFYIKTAVMGVFFPAIWIALISWFIFNIPFMVVDFIRYKKRK